MATLVQQLSHAEVLQSVMKRTSSPLIISHLSLPNKFPKTRTHTPTCVCVCDFSIPINPHIFQRNTLNITISICPPLSDVYLTFHAPISSNSYLISFSPSREISVNNGFICGLHIKADFFNDTDKL